MSAPRYLVTARKYRPATFAELVAQEHVTETLQNALRLDRLAHAYLFSGPRGVGKTTAARILAKAINCQTPLDERAGEAEPCRQCASCESFEAGRSLNIFEIDAASNNKVDDIRELRETVRIPPQGSRKKVYIIDEVHMLSTAAFNALLKTLEEPPPHVLFIFATTEPHKVLPTILSRCQRFDFRRIPVPEIVARLSTICQEESITADDEALMLIARKGDGALRDALSAFDQAVSLCGTDLRYPALAQALRVVDVDLFFEVTSYAQARDSAGMLQLVGRIVQAGYDLREFLHGLAEHLRNLLVARAVGDTALIEAAAATQQRYAQAAAGWAETDLLRLLLVVDEAEGAIRDSPQPRMKLELALLKLVAVPAAADLRTALGQIERLEELARAGKLPAAASQPATSAADAPQAAPPLAHDPAETYTPAPPPPVDVYEPARAEAHEPASAVADASPQSETSETVDAPSSDQPEAAVSTPNASASEGSAPEASSPEASGPETSSPETPAALDTAAPASTTDEAASTTDEADDDTSDDTPPPPDEPPSHDDIPPPPMADAPAAPKAPSFPDLFGQPALKKIVRRESADREAEPRSAHATSGALQTPSSPVVTATVPLPALQRVERAWNPFVQRVKAERIHVGALLQHAAPVHAEAATVTIGVPDDFHKRLLGSQEAFLLNHLRAETADTVDQLVFTVREDLPATSPDPAAAPTVDPVEYMQRKRQESPVVQAIFERFGGELVW